MIHVERGGDGPLLVLLHGLGATAEVWEGVAARWPGSWLAVDLPGHGRSSALERYSFGSFAAAVASVVPAGPVAVLGHSLGGVVALALASGWFGVDVRAVAGVGVKLRWSDDDLAKAAALASRPARVFPTADEAAGWASKLAGVPLSHGVVETADGWRASLDVAAFGVGAPDVPGLLAASKAPVTLAAGDADHMCPREHLLDAAPGGMVLAGVGHNAHVEQPESIKPVLERLITG
ncbi:pimeloyl-ACP methyl ester carboxylesterase [Saccharothrix tamanrassetensis]|uniref:Pimeloyl-ACP methyl ester carboxylesterase n=1 Tax=Saccharothrix tamanrassetensis TaxID=1051531 RepID=A0A841CG52_9PSEU|nr:alpha/beta fold hydrolase [Saccharothrix tamanrassetensis]MBB5956321.1 pimeloyl-ACP methyl ester carboxylesterase [Saccharothrix tamanrassetensis]